MSPPPASQGHVTGRLPAPGGVVESVNVGTPRPVQVNGHTVLTAIWKHREDIDWWEAQLQRSVGAAPFGENLTVKGLPVSEAVIGEPWSVGSALLQVAQPRLPCFKLGVRMDDPRFLKCFVAAGRPGAYLRILREGDVAAGDAIAVHSRPAHAVTSALVSRALLGERHLLPAALQAPELPADLRAWIQQRAA
jgi:MOSC domain-containing protein YiiM